MVEFARIQGHGIEFERIEIAPGGPVMVFLHEGLGSRAMWRDFPAQCARQAGVNALVYSRYGYGKSDTLGEPRRPDYMHREALEALPELLEKLGIERPVLFGHSDGASIALIYAAAYPTAGVIALAPHVFIEAAALGSIRAIRQTYGQTDLREKLARYHDDPDGAFWGWNNIWLDAGFRDWCIEDQLARIECQVLAIQGFDDEYGTMEQVDRMGRMIPRVELLKLEKCRHSAHRDQPEAVIKATARFLRGLNTPNGRETSIVQGH